MGGSKNDNEENCSYVRRIVNKNNLGVRNDVRYTFEDLMQGMEHNNNIIFYDSHFFFEDWQKPLHYSTLNEFISKEFLNYVTTHILNTIIDSNLDNIELKNFTYKSKQTLLDDENFNVNVAAMKKPEVIDYKTIYEINNECEIEEYHNDNKEENNNNRTEGKNDNVITSKDNNININTESNSKKDNDAIITNNKDNIDNNINNLEVELVNIFTTDGEEGLNNRLIDLGNKIKRLVNKSFDVSDTTRLKEVSQDLLTTPKTSSRNFSNETSTCSSGLTSTGSCYVQTPLTNVVKDALLEQFKSVAKQTAVSQEMVIQMKNYIDEVEKEMKK